MSTRPPRSARRTLVFVLVQVILTVAALEIGLRLARGSVPQLGALLHLETVQGRHASARTTEELLSGSALGYRPGGAAGGVRLNERGFATAPYDEPAAEDERRVAVLGDSFVFNDFPHEWMWHTLLAERLGDGARTVSLGVPATSPDFYLRLWQLEGRRTGAELVLVGLTIGNDLTDDAVAPLEAQRRSPLLRWSLAARALRNGAVLARYRWASSETPSTPGEDEGVAPGEPLRRYAERFDEEAPTLPSADFRELTWKRTVVSRRDREQDLQKWLDRLRPVLAGIDEAVRASGARCVFVLFPDEYQVDHELRESVVAEYGAPDTRLAVARPQRRLQRFFDRQGLLSIDLLETFRAEAENGAQLYRPRDTHWNRRGNELAAEAIAEALRARGLWE